MRDKPIIKSRMDLDFYEYTMGQLFWKHCRKTPIELTFINRTLSVRLAEDLIDLGELREQLQAYQTLPYTRSELDYIQGIYEYGQPMFSFGYIEFLRDLKRLPDFELERQGDGQLRLQFYGPASEATYWEIPSMIICKSLYYKALTKNFTRTQRDAVEARGRINFAEKIPILRKNKKVNLAEFGTRRRASFEMQRYVVEGLKEEIPSQFRGTSNVLLAKEFEVTPVGTNSHKGPMIYSGIYWEKDNVYPWNSQRQFLADWEAQHGLALSIFLSDTWSSPWFFQNVVTPAQLQNWKGARHDSGNPFKYTDDRVIGYQVAGVRPLSKFIVFADNLTAKKICDIADYCDGKIGQTCGWGTDATSDVGLPLISLVTKVTRSNGHEIAKLSDNIEKATGTREAIDRLKRLIGYKETYSEKCVS